MIALAIEAQASNILSMPFKDLPLGGGSHIIDANRAVMCAHGEALSVVVEGYHREYLHHVG